MSLKRVGATALALAAPSAASAVSPLTPYVLTGTTYMQTFDTLDRVTTAPSQNLPAGFQIAEPTTTTAPAGSTSRRSSSLRRQPE